MRQCIGCKEEKDEQEFHKHYKNKARTRFNFSSYCKPCARALNREYYHKNKEVLANKRKERVLSQRAKIGVAVHHGFSIVDEDEKRKRESCRHKAIALRKKGLIKDPGYCQFCAIEGMKLEMHHAKYDLPSSVVFLCRPCHLKMHWNVLKDKIR